MSRPTLEVADLIRAQGERFVERYRSWLSLQQLSVLRAIGRCRTAALGGHIDACPRCDQQAISYNSCRNRHCPKCQAQARQRWLAAREQRSAWRALLPRRLHAAARTSNALRAKPEGPLWPLVPGQRADLVRGSGEPEASRRSNRLPEHSAHLGAKPVAPSPPLLCHSRRRTFFRSHPLGTSQVCVLPTGQGAQSRLSRQVRRRLTASSPPQQAQAQRLACDSQRSACLCRLPADLVPSKLGRLRQARLRRTGASAPLSRSLYASRRHQQPSLVGLRRRVCHFPLERLCEGQPAAEDDTQRDRVLTPLGPTCAAARLRSHPAVRLTGSPLPQNTPRTRASVARLRARPGAVLLASVRRSTYLAMPPVFYADANRASTYACPTRSPMQLLRQLVVNRPPPSGAKTCNRTPTYKCARAAKVQRTSPVVAVNSTPRIADPISVLALSRLLGHPRDACGDSQHRLTWFVAP